MKTVDNLLQDLIFNNFYSEVIEWQVKDKKVLESIGYQIRNNLFLTENQANLLLKILYQYKVEIEKASHTSLDFISNPVWSKPFRQLDQVKKVFISDTDFGKIVVEFTFNKKIKDKLFNLSKTLDGDIHSIKNNQYVVDLTEKNVLTIVENLQDFQFNFDEKIVNYYKEIVSIKESSTKTFDFKDMYNVNFIKKFSEDVGENNINDITLIHDRKHRYQYTFHESLEKKSLENNLALRTHSDVYVNSSNYSFQDIVLSLKALQRFPILVIFDQHKSKQCIELLDTIHHAFSSLNIEENIGIYFRLDNTTNKDFNQKISSLKFNCYLDNSTNLVGLSNKSLPKFLVKDKWKPKSLICFTPSFKNSKIYSYCDNVDLKICYSDIKPITGFDYAIM